jgi:hypothetical protein
MTSYKYHQSVCELSGLSHATESPADGVRSDFKRRKTAMESSEVDSAMSTRPTLDDFGGRSDALGG